MKCPYLEAVSYLLIYKNINYLIIKNYLIYSIHYIV